MSSWIPPGVERKEELDFVGLMADPTVCFLSPAVAKQELKRCEAALAPFQPATPITLAQFQESAALINDDLRARLLAILAMSVIRNM